MLRNTTVRISAVPDLVSLHDTLFVALQTSSQTLLIKTHSLLILQMKQAQTILESRTKRFTLQAKVATLICLLICEPHPSLKNTRHTKA